MALLPSAWRHEEVSDGKGPVSYPPLPEDETWRLPRKPKVEELRKFLPFYEGSIDVAPTILASKGFVGLVLPLQESTVRPKEDYLEMTPEIPQRTPGIRDPADAEMRRTTSTSTLPYAEAETRKMRRRVSAENARDKRSRRCRDAA